MIQIVNPHQTSTENNRNTLDRRYDRYTVSVLTTDENDMLRYKPLYNFTCQSDAIEMAADIRKGRIDEKQMLRAIRQFKPDVYHIYQNSTLRKDERMAEMKKKAEKKAKSPRLN